MKTALFLLALTCLCPVAFAGSCAAGATKDSGCADCVDASATSDCNWCSTGYYKTGPKACTICPTGRGREINPVVVASETDAVCHKCAVQLNCQTCSDPFTCITKCAEGRYLEAGLESGVNAVGCTTQCNTYGTNRLVPKTANPPVYGCQNCAGAASNCAKCEYTSTQRANADSTAGVNVQQRTCLECSDSYYLVPNADATIVPSCVRCGANCKKCKDKTDCTECLSGWAKDAGETGTCSKQVSTSSDSSLITASAMLAILAHLAY